MKPLKSYFVAVLALVFSIAGIAQTIPTPANSADSGGRATVTISGMTASQVTNIVNQGLADGSIASGAASYVIPWGYAPNGAPGGTMGYATVVHSGGLAVVSFYGTPQAIMSPPFVLYDTVGGAWYSSSGGCTYSGSGGSTGFCHTTVSLPASRKPSSFYYRYYPSQSPW